MGKGPKLKTPEERQQELDEAMKRVKAIVLAQDSAQKPVQDRIKHLASRPDELPAKAPKDRKSKPLSLAELAKQGNELEKKTKAAGLNRPVKELTPKDKEKEKKKEQEKENTPEKQEQKMKEMYSKIKLPSGMEIHQEGPSWVLISKDGKQRTDVTDVMNTIDKFNRNVDAANNANKVQNQAQSNADKAVAKGQKDLEKNEGLAVNETSGRVEMVGKALPNVKIEGTPVFKPEDIKKVAEVGIQHSEDLKTLEKLKNPKALEEMKKREKKNEETAQLAALKAQERVHPAGR